MSKPLVIDRPPRIQPELPFDEVEIPSPPDKGQSGWEQLAQMALPLVTILAFVFLAGGGGGPSALMIIPMALAVIASAGVAIFIHLRHKRIADEALRVYEKRLIELNKQMRVNHDMQRRFYHYNYPDVPEIFRLVKSARTEVEKANRTLRADTRLWERRSTDEDFGAIRLGIGALPSTVVFRFNKSDDLNNPHVRQAIKLVQDARFVDDIPVLISLRKSFEGGQPGEEGPKSERENQAAEACAAMMPMTHALGVVGERTAVYEYVRALIAHFAVFHAPMDARLFVLAARKQEWAWTDQLQHCQSDVETEYRFFLDQVKPDQEEKPFDEADEGPLVRYLEGLRRILATRKIQLESRDNQEGTGDPTLPFQLVLVDLLDSTYDEESPLYDLESDAAISILIEQGAALGAAIIFLVPERAKVPGGCQSVIEIECTTPVTDNHLQTAPKLYFRYAEVGVNTFRYVGVADAIANRHMDALVGELSQYEVRKGPGASLVSAVPFLDLHGFRSLADLQADVGQKWRQSQLARNANWLRCKIGRMAGNKPRTLVFSAKRDGVHGMVAGSTGSGKSELLISLIAGMAITYDPSVLNFVLVDYKGGGAFKEFEDLPHCVDIITNLEGDAVTRMFTAITAEMKRRQKLNADTGTKNIVEYRQRGLHESHYPYPYLFIIIDEFAEMIASRAEYRTDLESLTRVGRAQGVSLILAAQRPSSVTNQMRSNIKSRICLRVETPGESREIIHRTDAAFLPRGIPGRGYLQVGNEEVELIQVAYTGDKYRDPTLAPPAPVIWPGRPAITEAAFNQEPSELYKVLITTLQRQAQEMGCAPQYAPWPAPLPKQLNLEQPLIDEDPDKPAVTAARYLANVDQLTLGQPAEGSVLTLNPALARWRGGECGWVDPIDWEHHAMRPVVGLVDDPYAARQLPLTVELRSGHVVIFGGSGWGKTTFLRTLVVSLAATHSPNTLRVYILDLGGYNLAVLANLPHVGAVVNPNEAGYEERVEQVLRQLEDEVETRKVTLADAGVADIYKYNQAHPDALLPAILLAVDNFVEFRETFGDAPAEEVETAMDKFVALARQGKPYGVHCVTTVNQLGAMPVQLYNLFTERLTLKLDDPTDCRQIVGGFVGEQPDVAGRGYVKAPVQPLSFQIATPLDLRRGALQEPANEARELQRLGQAMNDHIANSGQSNRMPASVDILPRSILFKQILGRKYGLELDESFLPQLKRITKEQWTKSVDPNLADWLRVTVGVVSGNRLREMYLEAKADGVHGLIAGSNGAGKSELLMTLIVGLALNYDPSILNLVLVDYKGGGTFMPFTHLPHCVDNVANPNKAAVRRMFTVIDAEMDRRMKLCVDTGVSNIVEYRAKGFHRTRESFPHLLVIIDEFAELISENPEFKDELDRITRVGSSIGVNLLLAAQQPIGVTDQMRANINYRICLRVEAVDTSREILRRPDAAFLPNGMPGRGFLQVGNEKIELIQMASTGENCFDAPLLEGGQHSRFYDVMVRLCNELLVETKAVRPRTPWPPPLPKCIGLQSTVVNDQRNGVMTLTNEVTGWLNGDTEGLWPGVNWETEAMRPVAGLVDNPVASRSFRMHLDLTWHLAVFGDSGWGKTCMLRTLITSLAATHSPNELHIYVVDLGGHNYPGIEDFPHVGTVVYSHEEAYEERLHHLLTKLGRLANERAHLLGESAANNLWEYNARYPDQALPAVLVVVDNFVDLYENHEALVETEIIPLVRRSLNFGICFVVSANAPTTMPKKLYALFGERITFKQSNTGRLRDIVGRDAMEIDDIPGRGYIRIGQQPLLFQAALPMGIFGGESARDGLVEEDGMRLMGKHMQGHLAAGHHVWRHRPDPIAILPASVALIDLLETAAYAAQPGAESPTEQSGWEAGHDFLPEGAGGSQRIQAMLGTLDSLQPAMCDLKALGPHFAIVGPPLSGKTTAMLDWILSLAERYPPEQAKMVLIDTQRKLIDYGGKHTLNDLPHVVAAVTEMELEGLIANLKAEGVAMAASQAGRELFVFIDNFDDFSEEIESQRAMLESMSRLVRRYQRAGLHFVVAFGPEASTSDLCRRVLAAGYGVGLQTAQAVDVLKVSRTPPGVRDNSMPIGRGYLVKFGQPVLIQVASPYEKMVDSADLSPWSRGDDQAREAERVVKALDAWVERITARYGGARAAWSAASTASEPIRTGQPSAEEDVQTRQMRDAGQATAGEASSAAPTAATTEESETAKGAIAEGSTEQEVGQ